MKNEESIKDIISQFTNIFTCLNSLGKLILADFANKIRRSHPKCRASKVPAIQEAKDLKTLPLYHMIGSLITHEMKLGGEAIKKTKGIAFRATMEREERLHAEEMVLLTRNFKRF